MPFAPNNATFQRDVADQLRRLRARKVAGRAPREQATRPRDHRGPHGKQFQILDQIERAEREIADISQRVRSQSESLAKRLGAVLEKTLNDDQGHDHVYRHPKPEVRA